MLAILLWEKIRQRLLSTCNDHQTPSSCNDYKSDFRKGADGRVINISNIGQGKKELEGKAESSIESSTRKKIAIRLPQSTPESDISYGYSVDHFIKYVQFPLSFNGERFKVKGTVTHLQIKWQYGDQTGCAQVPINQAIPLDRQSMG